MANPNNLFETASQLGRVTDSLAKAASMSIPTFNLEPSSQLGRAARNIDETNARLISAGLGNFARSVAGTGYLTRLMKNLVITQPKFPVIPRESSVLGMSNVLRDIARNNERLVSGFAGIMKSIANVSEMNRMVPTMVVAPRLSRLMEEGSFLGAAKNLSALGKLAGSMRFAPSAYGPFFHTNKWSDFVNNPALSDLMKPNPVLETFRQCFGVDSALRLTEERSRNAFGAFFHISKRVDLPDLGRLNRRLTDSLVNPIPRIDIDRILRGLNRESLYKPRGPLIRPPDLCQDVDDVEEIQNCEPQAAELTLWEVVDRLRVSGRRTAAREFQEALHDLSRGPYPDLTGAIQHAMAALECVLRIFSGNEKPTMGAILKRYPGLVPSPLDGGLEKVWGYSSSVARHVREGAEPTQSEARLVVWLAGSVIVYLIEEGD